MTLFALSVGLALIFGMMRVLNLSHGAFYAVGAWIGISAGRQSGSIVFGALCGVVAVVLIGLMIERLLRYIPKAELPQTLLTFGAMLVLGDLSLWYWGGTPLTIEAPGLLQGVVSLQGIVFPKYRLFVAGFGVVLAICLWLIETRTRIGMMIRAAIDDPLMAQSAGVNVPLLTTVTFAFGAALAALAGVVAAPVLGVQVGMEFDVLLLSFVVVVIGGLGSLRGAMVGALLIGLMDSVSKALFPELALFSVFVPMALILALKPSGLFGR
ncbi:branched-chain amino acid ABC transporter permease [Bradyrhizobium manausense]